MMTSREMKRDTKRAPIALCAFITAGMFLVPAVSLAAHVYLDPAQKQVRYGDTFVMNIRIETEKECVNAVDMTINYDTKVIEAVDFSRGESLVSLWIQQPIIDRAAGTITFSGGIPGGYCGRIVGDPGPSNSLGKIVFSTTGSRITPYPGGVAIVSVATSSQVLLNDGLGTPAELQVDPAQVVVLEQTGEPVNEWTGEIAQDTIPPEEFEVSVHQDPNVEDGKYFITFTAIDKQSGIDHFEVFESSLENPGYEVGTGKEAEWRVVGGSGQYYVLIDQTLTSKVIVKAIDKAGNVTLAELGEGGAETAPSVGMVEKIVMGAIGIGIVLVLLGAVMLIRRRRNGGDISIVHDHDNDTTYQ